MKALGIIGKILGHTLLGAVLLPLVVLVAMIAIYIFDSRCGSPGDSGGCEMGMAVNVLTAIPVGAGAGLIAGIVKLLRGRDT